MNIKFVVGVVLVIGCGVLVAAVFMMDGGADSSARLAGAGFEREDGQIDGGVSAYGEDFAVEKAAEVPEVMPRREGHVIGQRSGNAKTRWAMIMERMHEFDADGDGVLSDLEKMQMGEQLKNEWMQKYDVDGDGEISPEEMEAWQVEQFVNSDWGQDMMRKFDFDQDGILSPDEETALRARLEEMDQDRKSNELAEFDQDGDGEISESEREVQREQQRQWWANATKAAVAEHDEDGDGELNIEESISAWDAWIQRQSIADFIKRFDSNANGKMDIEDYDRFTERYRDGNLDADVNRDGVINMLDLAAYRDLVERAED